MIPCFICNFSYSDLSFKLGPPATVAEAEGVSLTKHTSNYETLKTMCPFIIFIYTSCPPSRKVDMSK